MKTIVLTLCLSFLITSSAWAGGRFSLGPDIGFSYRTHRAPSDGKLSGNAGLTFGLSGTYEFSGDLDRLALDYSVGYTLLPRFTYRDVTINGVTGTYKEKLDVIHWYFGARYHFLSRKWRPYAGLDIGFEFFNRRNIEFRDEAGALRAIPPHSNHLNFAFVPQVGIEYRPTFRWAFGLALKLPMSIRTSGVVPAIQVPLTVHFAF